MMNAIKTSERIDQSRRGFGRVVDVERSVKGII
jgi:hypothetical protein